MNRYTTNIFSYLYILSIIFFISCVSNNKEKTTITILGENSSNLRAMEALKSEYEKKNNVTIDFKPNTFENTVNKANQDFTNKTGQYDIVLLYNFSLSSFVRNKFVYKLSELEDEIPDSLRSFEKDLFPNAWKEVGYYYKNPDKPTSGITQIGYPFAANTKVMVYNKKLFNNETNREAYKIKYEEELSVPKDWNQFKRVAEFFTKNNMLTDKNTYGVCMQGATGGWLYYEFCNYLFGLGGSVMDKQYGWEGNQTTDINLTSPESINATEFYVSMKKYNAGNYLTVDQNEQLKIIREGNVAMAFVWSDFLYELAYDENGNINPTYGFVPIPGNKSALAGGSFYINKQSKKPLDALKYIISLMQVENQIALAKIGLCSPLRTTYNSPEMQDIPYNNALKQSLERGVYMFEAGPDADLISQTLTKYIQELWQGEISVKQALDNAQAEIEIGRIEIYKNL